ncbi:Ribonucleases P/MRP protein subunit pop1 [Rhodotorula sphaerocarpa]
MPPKRSSDGPTSGAALKRQRMREQRTIAVEGGGGGGGAYARAGGSAKSGNVGLPPVLEVEKFVQARAFEITAMQRAMKAAKSLSNVPKDAAKPKRVTRSMLGRHRQRPGMKAEMFKKRQQHKQWLETHVWHAKRMHMTEIWGHRLADRPTAKAFRASYRASQHGALVHDASYYQYFELEGPFEQLKAILDEVCDPSVPSPASKRYSTGSREVSVDLYDPKAIYPLGRLGPATFIWKPTSELRAGPIASTSTSPPAEPLRTVLVRVHPAVARSAALAVEHVILDKRLGLLVALRRFEDEYLTFEVCGRRATQVVKAVLKPINSTDSATKGAWQNLDSQAGPASVPTGMILGFEVYDPRLSFPPQLKTSVPRRSSPLMPSADIADVSPFWSAKHCAAIRKPRFKKRELDARRSQNLVPGTRLAPLAQDDRIPILLSQRTLSSPSSSEDAIYGWTLTVPAGWGMPFWSSLVYSTPRAGGLRERSQQHQEATALRFPEDYVDVPAFDEHEIRREADERGYWERRPPAKRPSYAKLGTASPWRVSAETFLGSADRTSPAAAEKVQPFVVAPTIARRVVDLVKDDSISHRMQEDSPSSEAGPRARREQLVQQLLKDWRTASSVDPPPGRDLLASALVHVRITPCTRGVPQDLALVYEPGSQQAADMREKLGAALEWKAVLATGEGDGPEDLLQDRPEQQPLVLFRNRDVETFRAATLALL